MPSRLPSLTALRSFEAAARHLSFAAAANELAVTPAAISYQVRDLEQDLGAALFERGHRSIALTPKGTALFDGLAGSFQTIAQAWEALARPSGANRRLRITIPFADQRYLFRDEHGALPTRIAGFDLSWDISTEVRDVAGGEVDIALRLCVEPPAGIAARKVFHNWFTPVARRDVAKRLRQPGDVSRHGLIHNASGFDFDPSLNGWDIWCRAAGLAVPQDFSQVARGVIHAVELALASDDLAIGGSGNLHSYGRTDQLAAPFDLAFSTPSAYWLLVAEERQHDPGMTDVLEWMDRCFDDLRALGRRFRIVPSSDIVGGA